MNRLTDTELLLLLDDLESDRVERKQSFKGDTPDKARQAVCAFANDISGYNMPGVLFIGAFDNGEPSFEPVTDELLISLADIKTDGNILPLPAMTVEKRIVKNSEMAVITVLPSDMPPVKYKGRIWIRTGPRRVLANEQDERILIEKRRYKNLPFDLFPIPNAGISDLSKVLFENEYLPQAFSPEILLENNRSYEEKLASCKMVSSVDEATPTLLGLLSIGKCPQDYIPGARIQFLRIDGVELSDRIADEELIGGAIVEMLRRADEKIKAHNRVAVDITSDATHDINQHYPITAIRQILYNAIQHRTYENTNAPVRIYWYDDRIEIISPGGPYGGVTVENFGRPGITDYRNPNISAALRTYGYIQSFGRGIIIAKNELKRNGNPPLEFIVNQSVVICTIRRSF